MILKAQEESTTYYSFNESVLKDYKEWAKNNNKSLDKFSFLDFILNYDNIADYIDNENYSGDIIFENFNEWINQ